MRTYRWVRPVACAWAMIDGTSPPSVYCGCQIHMPLPEGTTGVGGGGGTVVGGTVVVGTVVVGATVVVDAGVVVDVVVGTGTRTPRPLPSDSWTWSAPTKSTTSAMTRMIDA